MVGMLLGHWYLTTPTMSIEPLKRVNLFLGIAGLSRLIASTVAVLFLGFIAWIATRTMHADGANYWVGRIIIWDLYALAVIMCYVAFVGGFIRTRRLDPFG